MPLPLRRVEPVHVSRGTLPERFPVQNDLEAVANGTLANVIVQLSSLSHHAEELFGDLIRVGTEIANRANNLQARIDRLAVKVVQLDSSHEELGTMQEALNTKPFQSSMSFDQQVVSRNTMHAAMHRTYLTCDKPPPLEKLNSYRDDGRDGLKFYTDPSYFFDLWREEMLKATDKVTKKHQSLELNEPQKPKQDGGQRHKKRVRQPHNTRERFRHIAIEQGEQIMQGPEYNRPGVTIPEMPDGVIYHPEHNSIMAQRQMAHRPISIELDKSYSPGGYNESPYGNGMDANNRGDYRLNHPQHPNSAILNRTISQSHYDYDSYNNQVHNQSQNRYYNHGTPPPPYSEVSSPNAYSNTSRFSVGIAAASTPRNGSISMSGTPTNMTNGYGFRPSQPPPAPPPNFVGTPPSSHSGTPTRSTRILSSRDTLPPPPPPPTEGDTGHMNGIVNGNPHMPPPSPMHDEDHEDLPPPPPPPDSGPHGHNSIENLAPSPELVPPPPPPPPMSDTMNVNSSSGLSNGGFSKPIERKEKKVVPAPKVDGHSELLKSIRDGIELRKVETKKEPNGKEDKAGGTYGDVASILARRVAVEMSDSESGSDSEYDSDQWDETSA